MISLRDYFGQFLDHEDATPERKVAAEAMLDKVNALLIEAEAHGIHLQENPATQTLISGFKYGGFRPQACKEGAPNSSHKEGRGIDIWDLFGELDNWLTDKRLEAHDLAREHPSKTIGWTHLTDRLPPSGRRTFFP